jgi:hypothetical protein
MSHRITQQEVQPLPRWARLAFAARCLRRARGLAGRARALDSALDLLDSACRAGSAGDELADAAAGAYTLALDNLDARPGAADHDREVIVCMLAHATAFAAEAATLSDPRQAAHLVAQSVDFAVHALRLAEPARAAAALESMRTDLARVREAAAQGGWDDRSPVPPNLFAALRE